MLEQRSLLVADFRIQGKRRSRSPRSQKSCVHPRFRFTWRPLNSFRLLQIVKPARAITPPPPPPPKPILPPKPCLLCKRIEPKVALAQCIQCTLSVHASCYGIYDGTPLEDWLCDLCELDEKKTPLNAVRLSPRSCERFAC